MGAQIRGDVEQTGNNEDEIRRDFCTLDTFFPLGVWLVTQFSHQQVWNKQKGEVELHVSNLFIQVP